jgi:hypothetical protein
MGNPYYAPQGASVNNAAGYAPQGAGYAPQGATYAPATYATNGARTGL